MTGGDCERIARRVGHREHVPGVHCAQAETQNEDNTPPAGFAALFNGKDLTGWQALLELPGLRSGAGLDPAEPGKLSPDERAAKQREADAKFLPHWTVRDGVLRYHAAGQSGRSGHDPEPAL